MHCVVIVMVDTFRINSALQFSSNPNYTYSSKLNECFRLELGLELNSAGPQLSRNWVWHSCSIVKQPEEFKNFKLHFNSTTNFNKRSTNVWLPNLLFSTRNMKFYTNRKEKRSQHTKAQIYMFIDTSCLCWEF